MANSMHRIPNYISRSALNSRGIKSSIVKQFLSSHPTVLTTTAQRTVLNLLLLHHVKMFIVIHDDNCLSRWLADFELKLIRLENSKSQIINTMELKLFVPQ